MRTSLLLYLFLALGFHALVSGICVKKPLKVVKKGNEKPRKMCVLDFPSSRGKVEIPRGSKVKTPACLECECKESFILCCTKDAPNKDSVPKGCKVIKDNCEYRIVKSDNTSIECVQPTLPTTVAISNLDATTDAIGSAFNTVSPLSVDTLMTGNSLAFQDPPLLKLPSTPTVQARPPVQLSTGSSLISALANVLGHVMKPSPWGGGWLGGRHTFMGQEVEGEWFSKNPMLAMAVMRQGSLPGSGSGGGAGGFSSLISSFGTGLASALGSTGSTGTGTTGLLG